MEVWGCNISRELWRKIGHIQKQFITYNLNIKRNTPYPILLIEVIISLIENMTMTSYLMYNMKLNNMEAKRFPKLFITLSKTAMFGSSEDVIRIHSLGYTIW